MNEPLKGRMQEALLKLEEDPPEGDIKAMVGQNGYRVRVGGTRILFEIKDDKVYVTSIQPRGQIYKEGGRK